MPSTYAKSSVTTFGSIKAPRSEHNLGGDGAERSSVKVHHPPGGGGSLNLFGGTSEPTYAPAKYVPKKYSPASYEEDEYSAPAAGGYGGGSSYSHEKSPLTDFNYNYEEGKYSAPSYYDPPAYEAPSSYTSSASYGVGKVIQPTSLSVSNPSSYTFGKRVESGSNSGPTTGKSSTKIHAPPGGKSSIFF